jgi:hypothetical protein
VEEKTPIRGRKQKRVSQWFRKRRRKNHTHHRCSSGMSSTPTDDVQQEPPVDAIYCGFCLITPCLFLQWQDDIEGSEPHMDPEETNRAKQVVQFLP